MRNNNLNNDNLFKLIINSNTNKIEFGFTQGFNQMWNYKDRTLRSGKQSKYFIQKENNYIKIEEDNQNHLVYLQAVRNDRETTKPILASKELIEMLKNDSVEYDEKTIYNYNKSLHRCLRPELDVYFYNLKSQG